MPMPDVRVRNLESWVLESLKAQAKKHGRTLELELRTLLHDEALRSKRELADSFRGFQQATSANGQAFRDSAELIRAARHRA